MERLSGNDLTDKISLCQLAIGVKDQLHSFPQIRTRFVESCALRVRARQFLDERDVPFRHFDEDGGKVQRKTPGLRRGLGGILR
jgi:hypothetical protein